MRTGSGPARSAGRAALDLGTSRTRLLLGAAGSGSGSLVVDGPVVVERPSGVTDGPWPVRHGMVADTAACARLVRGVLRRALPGRRVEALDLVLIGVPVAASDLDRRAACAAVGHAAGCRVPAVEEPLAAAVGCGVDIADPRPQLLLDVGAGIVEAVVIHGGGIADAGAVQILDGDPVPPHVRERIAAMVADLISRLPPQMRRSSRERGLLITGGGAGHRELARRLCADLRIAVTPAPDPAHATVKGLACLLSPPGSACPR